ncbi:hypothetical protein IL306_003465 [Fusarium sp. DS 682]|nr:hypothetical protein IL306_003465 [Fusarium sp. DS 682]
MSLEKRPEPAKLRDRIDTKLQNVRADIPPNVAFIGIWQDVKTDYESMRQVINQYLSRLVDEKGVRATVYSRTKTVVSISKSINRRNDSKPDGNKYHSPQQIFNDLHDLVGFRIVADYPSGLEMSYELIETRFQKEKYNSFPSNREVGQNWQPRFGAYETRNYLVRLASGCSEELAIYDGVLFEIQVTTMAESLYNKLAHPLLYKASQGPLSRNEEMIIDMGHGAALLYWISVACMEERLEGNADGTPQKSRFPQPVKDLAAHDGALKDLDAVVDATPDMPSISQESTSIDLLLKSLADLRLSNVKGEDLWEIIRNKLGLRDRHSEPILLPMVPEARFDGKDLEERPKCHEKTRREVRNKIRRWVDDAKGETLFWLHAPAGVGKSTLARTLVDDLRSQSKLAAGYFFNRGSELRNDTCRVFPTIASQLIKTIPEYTNSLRQSLGSSNAESIEKISLRDQFDTLLYKPLSSTPCCLRNMLIIIDALDECTRSNDIPLMLELFARFNSLNNFRLCVLLSSRETRPLINAFKPFKDAFTCRDMALHEEFLKVTQLEIKMVLKDGLADIKSKRLMKRDPWPSFHDFNRVLNYAINPSPLFIYASTFLRHIDGRNPAKRLERWLESSRKSVSQLGHIYDPIMSSILAGEGGDDIPEPLDEDEVIDLQLIVGSLVLLAKPLPARALQNLLALEEDSFNTTLDALHAVVGTSNDESPLELIHKSFADYVLGIENETAGTFKIDASQIHDRLAKRCVDRMRRGLRKNICNVNTPSIMSCEFDQDNVTKSIPPDLAYASRLTAMLALYFCI